MYGFGDNDPNIGPHLDWIDCVQNVAWIRILGKKLPNIERNQVLREREKDGALMGAPSGLMLLGR